MLEASCEKVRRTLGGLRAVGRRSSRMLGALLPMLNVEGSKPKESSLHEGLDPLH